MVTVEEALTSDDPKVVKRLRGTTSAQITCDVNLLNKELSKKLGEEFVLDKISHQLIRVQKKKLTDHFEVIQKLHDRYICIRDEGDNVESEEKLVEQDISYMEQVTMKVCPILDEIQKYEDALTYTTKLKSLIKTNNDARDACLKSKADFMVVYNKINSEVIRIESYDDKSDLKKNGIQNLPTESLIRSISAAFNEVKKSCKKLNDSSKEAGLKDIESKPEFGYEDEHDKYMDLEVKLNTYELMKLPTHLNPEGDPPAATKATPLKINKPDNLAFSGNARDFAPFKRDFLAIVVPHRDASQIGIYLKQAVPEKHKYLIANKDLHDWRGMLDILEDELASHKIVIDQTVAEIEKMRIPSTDKAFVELVESLEKIERDLTTLEQLGEIANTSVLSKLESKLPHQISHDWAQKVVREKLSKKSSNEKFVQFMSFLKECKEITKYICFKLF